MATAKANSKAKNSSYANQPPAFLHRGTPQTSTDLYLQLSLIK
jgi:hypothetical protein